MAGIVLKCVGTHVPGKDASKFWVTQRRLVGHAARCWYLLLNGLIRDEGLEWALGSLVNLYADQGKLEEAEKMYQRALQGYEKVLGPKLVSTYIPALNAAQNLAYLYQLMGRTDEAREMFSRALRGLESVLGASNRRCVRISLQNWRL